MATPPPKPVNHGPSLPFKDFVQYLLQPLQDYNRRPGVKGRPGAVAPAELKRAAIAKFITRWRIEVGPDVFPFFRLLIPERDKDRSMYKIKEANMAKLFIKILRISPASEDAISIEKWKIPSAKGAAGDFPGRLYEVLRARAAISDWGDMTIDEVNEGLDQLSRCMKETEQRPILTKFYEKMSAHELRWLCCIILRVMKIGATERTIFDIWHPDAVKLFNTSSSLSRVCWELYDREHRLPDAEKDISVFSCFQPQLAAFRKEDIANVVKKMGGKTFYIEEKLDGERIQLHKSGDNFKYWSRKAKDYTSLYGNSYGDNSNQEGGGLTKYLQYAFDPKVKTLVLDGEMITWNDKFDAPVGFGSLKSAAKAEKNNSATSFDGHPFYCVFDILYLNGQSLTNYTLRDRRKALQRLIKPVLRRIEVVPVQEATKEFEVEARLRECIANASEGLVVKDPDTAYIPNDRNDSWIKVKPEYMEEFGENLDLLVIAAFWGEGRRGNRLSSFLCGLRDDDVNGEGPIPRFKTFARVGGGFNGPDYAQIDHMTEGRWQKFDTRNPPERYYEFAKTRTGTIIDAPDMWIAPQDSFVIQLKAASAAPSDQFASRVTLRFPRYECLREDKDWTTATSLTDFIHLQAQAAHDEQEKKMNAHIRRKKVVSKNATGMTIQGESGTFPNTKQVVESRMFQEMSFYVLTESKDLKLSKIELEDLIRRHSGTIVFHEGLPSPSTGPTIPGKRQRTPESHGESSGIFIIAERNVVRAASLISRGTHDILRPIWIRQCIQRHQVLCKEPRFMFFTTPSTEREISLNVDEYGDSYVNDVDVATLKTLLDNMKDPEASSRPSRETVAALKLELSELGEFPMWLFSRFHAYFDSASHASLRAKRLWEGAGGRVARDIHDTEITHMVVEGQSSLRVQEIRSILSLRDKVARVVELNWVIDCWEAQTVLSEDRYPVMAIRTIRRAPT